MHYPNMAIVAGTGRNVGKTLLCCKLIAHFAKRHPVVALKTSPHLHTLSEKDHILKQNRYFTLVDEQNFSSKDSSRMLQAGATRSYFLQYQNIALSKLLDHLTPLLPADTPVICESGSFTEYIVPGIYFFITQAEDASAFQLPKLDKARQLMIKPGQAEHFDVKLLSFEKDKISISIP